MMRVATGISRLDALLGGGLAPGLVVLASGAGQGKTTLAFNVARHAAIGRARVPVALFVLDLAPKGVMLRLMSAHARIPWTQVRAGKVPASVWPDLTRTAAAFTAAPLFIHDQRNLDCARITEELSELSASLRREGRRLGLVVLDYIELLREPGTSAAPELKRLAQSLDAPVLALSHVPRKACHPPSRPLSLADLSPAVAEAADAVLFIRRAPGDRVEVSLAKNRFGPLGSALLDMDPACGAFERHQG